MSNIIEEAIFQYLRSDDQLALQLNGSWGIGKTYFIKNYVIPTLESKNTKAKKHNKFIPIYVSLNGLNSLNELKNRINKSIIISTLNQNTKLDFNSGLFKLFNLVGNFTNSLMDFSNRTKEFKIFISKLGISNKDIQNVISTSLGKNNSPILFLDNLERVDNKKIDIKELVGFISDLLEETNNKMIIISNEKEIEKKSKKQFYKIKEKIINKTLNYNTNNVYYIAINILKNKLSYIRDASYQTYKNIIKISQILLSDKSININLRTIFNIISNFNEISVKLRNYNIDNINLKKQILMTGFISIFVLSYIKQNNIVTKYNDISDIFCKDNFAINVVNANNNILNKNNHSNINKDIKYILNTFHNKYDMFDKNIMYSGEIWDLVFHNIFDIKKFRSDIDTIFQDKIYGNKRYLELLKKYDHYKANNLKSIEDKASKQYTRSDTKFHQLINLYSIFKSLDNKKLLFIDFDNNDYNNLQDLIIKSIDNFEEEDFINPIINSDIKSIQDNNFKKKINNKIKNSKNNLIYKNDYIAAEKIMNNKILEIDDLEERFHQNRLFNILLTKKIFDHFINEPLPYIGVINFLKKDFLNDNKQKFNKIEEMEKADKLIKQLIKQKKQNNIIDEVVKFNLNHLVNVFKDTKEKMHFH